MCIYGKFALFAFSLVLLQGLGQMHRLAFCSRPLALGLDTIMESSVLPVYGAPFSN